MDAQMNYVRCFLVHKSWNIRKTMESETNDYNLISYMQNISVVQIRRFLREQRESIIPLAKQSS